MHSQFGDRGRRGEPLEIARELSSRTIHVEARERVKLASGLDVDLRRSGREQVERAPIAALRTARPARQHRLQARFPSGELEDPRRLEVVEYVLHDSVGAKGRHCTKSSCAARRPCAKSRTPCSNNRVLPSAAERRTGAHEHGASRRSEPEARLVVAIQSVLDARRERYGRQA